MDDENDLANRIESVLSWLPSRDDQIATYRRRRLEEKTKYGQWLLLIKETRVRYDCGLLEAERIALSNPHRRRWVELLINAHPAGRKHALAHIRYNGPLALLKQSENRIVVDLP